MMIYRSDDARCPAFLKTRRDARIVRLGEEALWIAPAGAEPAVLIAREDWARVHASCPGLAEFDALPLARRRDVLAAWLADAPAPASREASGQARTDDAEALLRLLREKLIACDRMDAADAVAAVESLVAWAREAPEEFVTGRVAPRADVRTLYLDTRPTADWAALAPLGSPPPAPLRPDTSTLVVSPSRHSPVRQIRAAGAAARGPDASPPEVLPAPHSPHAPIAETWLVKAAAREPDTKTLLASSTPHEPMSETRSAGAAAGGPDTSDSEVLPVQGTDVHVGPAQAVNGRQDTSGGEASVSRAGRPKAAWPVWAFGFAPGLAIEVRPASAEELDRSRAAREAHAALLRERQLTFSFFAGPLCATK